VAVCKDLCVSAPLRLGVKICRAEIKGSGRAAAHGARPSPAAAMFRRQRAFANPMPDGFATLLRPGTGALRRLPGTIPFGKRFLARRRKRQPGRSRSPAKTLPCAKGSLGWTKGQRAVEFSARRGRAEKRIRAGTSNIIALQRKNRKNEAP
jgi:hypothetical protein